MDITANTCELKVGWGDGGFPQKNGVFGLELVLSSWLQKEKLVASNSRRKPTSSATIY